MERIGSRIEKIRIWDGKNSDPGDVYPGSATLTWRVGAAVHPGRAGGRGTGPAARRGGPGRQIPGQAP
jgi:hypothetical protein